MFTGLVENLSKVININLSSKGAVIELKNPYDNLSLGESISINGVCQTVVEYNNSSFKVEAMPNTLSLTNLKLLKKGDIVNLERAMALNSRFGGHIVSGHIDNMVNLISKKEDGISVILRFSANTEKIVEKGSVCLNGVSLTVSNAEKNYFEVSIIPHTFKNTNLSFLNVGDKVNLEYDIIAKYIEKILVSKKAVIDENFLKENGF